MQQVDGIENAPVTEWLSRRGDLVLPLDVEVVEGGRSNLTYTVTDATGQRVVLRRPPLHGVLPSAHDVGREYRIVRALADSGVPVPPTVGYEPDPAVTGAPFAVTRFVDGVVVRTAEEARVHLDVAARTAAGANLVDVLARLHAVDVDAVGLGDLARREDYLARQLRRWHGQVHQDATRDLPVLDDVHDRLAADPPQQGTATLVHGDYRLDNLILDPATGRIRAVLDWELTTLGDPLADLGLLLVYWAEPGDDVLPLFDAPTTADGFWTRAQVAARYAEVSGRDVSHLDYYVAFGYWKLACILEGVHRRYAAGAYGRTDDRARAFGDLVLALGERAADAAKRAGR